MKTWGVLIAGMIIILAGTIAADRIIASSSNHRILTASPVQENHLRNIAALSGSWEGKWSGVVSGRLVVEDIHGKWATILYAWGDHPSEGVRQGEARTRAKILPDGRLKLGALTFAPSEDGAHLVGRWEQAGLSATVVMTRVAPGTPGNSLTATIATD
jgi:hypothetical protein